MRNNITEQYASTVISISNDVIKRYESNIEIIRQADEETQDLLHEAELSNPKDMYSGYLLYKNLKNARTRRRTAKNENELLKDLYDYWTSQWGQSVKSKFQQIQGNSVKTAQTLERRVYTPKQRSDLTITGHMPTANKPFESMLSEFMEDNKLTKSKGKWRK